MSNRYEPYNSRDRDHERNRDRDRDRDREKYDKVGPIRDRDRERERERDKHTPKTTSSSNNLPPKKPTPSASQMFVSGIKDLDDKALRSYFSQFGQITECRVMTDKATGQPKGFGFISFSDPSIAEKIINSGQTHNIQGKTIQTKPGGGQSQNPNQHQAPSQSHNNTSQHASSSGSSHPPKIIKPSVNSTTNSTPKSIDEINEGEDSEPAFTPIVGLGWVEAGNLYRPIGEEEQFVDEQGATIYIMCSAQVTEDILYDQFEGYGEVSKCILFPDKRNQSIIHGFITFSDPRSTQSSIDHMDGLLLLDTPMRVLLSLPPHIKNPHLPQHFVKNLAFVPTDPNAKMIPPPSLSTSEETTVTEEKEDPEVAKARELRLKLVVAEGVKAAHSAMKEIDSRLEDFSKTRQYNPDEYDY